MNPIKFFLSRIEDRKRFKAWEAQLIERQKAFQEEIALIRKEKLHEPFIREVNWPDELIEEYYATVTGWGFDLSKFDLSKDKGE